MGLFNKMRNLTGSVPKELLENGRLGRGIIVSIQQTSVSTGVDFDPSHVCVFTVEVALDETVTMASSGDPNTGSAAQILARPARP